MQVDWLTVAAQVINFLILVWLLHRFLYGPITRAMARRENRIKSRLEDAAQEREKAEEKQHELDEMLQELEEQREDKLERAREEAEDLKRKLEQEAREEVDRKREAWLAEMREDQREFITQLRARMAQGFRDLADDALSTLADSSLSERMAAVFLDRLHYLSDDDTEQLVEAAREKGQVKIESGQPLEADTRRKLTRAVHELVTEEVDVAYEGDVDGLVGIRLRAGSATIEWSVDDFLDRFVARLNTHFPEAAREAVEEQAEHEAQSDKRRKARAASEAIHD
ncbi:MAG: F0F1 ATP synthase subunit delta [Dichotomicrobium sp.]